MWCKQIHKDWLRNKLQTRRSIDDAYRFINLFVWLIFAIAQWEYARKFNTFKRFI